MRKIPATMVSQHPDNATRPYWHTEPYVSDQHEVKECFLTYSKLGVDEYKWDWEGKFVDESVFERLIGSYWDYFKKNQLGKDKFLTFRLPNFRVKTESRLGRAMIVITSAAKLSREIGLHAPPIFETIIPMVENEHEMIAVQEAFHELSGLKHKLFGSPKGFRSIEIIPLFELIPAILHSDAILERYLRLHKRKFNFLPPHIRPFLARSDSALNSGIVPAVLALKNALSNYTLLSKKLHIPIYPIIGAGSLPFRGGSTPYTVHEFLTQYAGVRTMLVQSAFQYDFDLPDVIKAINLIKKTINRYDTELMSPNESRAAVDIMKLFERQYRHTVPKIGRTIYEIAKSLPARRERLKHTGLLKYPRYIGKVMIPRAIGFTASLYSIGVPPEFIGTGRGLKQISKNKEYMQILEKFYPNFRFDIMRAGRFLNIDVLEQLAKRGNAWSEILRDVRLLEELLGQDFSPITSKEKEHRVITREIFDRFKHKTSIAELVGEAAILRNSLG